MTVEQVLRRIERECRKDMAVYVNYAPRWRSDDGGPIMKGARSASWGVVGKCREIRALCRKLRREHRKDKGQVNTPSCYDPIDECFE